MKKFFTLLVIVLGLGINAQIYSENIGSPSGTTVMSSYTGWKMERVQVLPMEEMQT